MKPNELKIRCSALGNIMHFDRATQITEKQSERLKELLSKIKLTERQAEERNRLIEKRDAPPELSKGAKTYVKDIFFGQRFEFQKKVSNKFTEKGREMENEAIRDVLAFLGLPIVFKNEKRFQNDFIHGEPDVNLSKIGFQFDTKNVYYPSGLDSFETKVDHVYEWQQHGYNWLLGVETGFVVKILKNPPEHLIEREAWQWLKESGEDRMTDDFFEAVRDMLDFESRIPLEDRIKIFPIHTTQEHINQIKDAVKLARIEYAELETKFKNKNQEALKLIKSIAHV